MTTLKMPSKAASEGIKNLLYDYLDLHEEDFIVVCFWHQCVNEVAWLICALEENAQKYSYYSFAHRDASRFASDLHNILSEIPEQITGKTVVLVCEEESLSFSAFLKNLQTNKGVKVWRIMNTGSHLFEQAFAVKKNALKNINANLLQKLMDASHQELYIENDYGTKLHVTIDNEKYHWISTYGVQKENELIIFPTGEINTFPANVSGQFVAFGSIHANIDLPFDARLDSKHVTLEFENGVLKNFHCPDNKINEFLKLAFSEEHLIKVGEFGIGTNIGITQFIGENSHINERFPGVHLGLGMHLQKTDVVSYKTPIHIDFINPYGKIYLNRSQSVIDLSELDQLAFNELSHPNHVSAEDGS